MTRLALLVAALLMAIATLWYATHWAAPEYRMADWPEDPDRWAVGV